MTERVEERELFESFAARSQRRGNELYFDRDTALDFIEACEQRDFAVIGIECFRLTQYTTLPEPSLIADYSPGPEVDWRTLKETNNGNARTFVCAAPDGVFFNFVIERTRSV